ncbi:MAG TPA: hypothetical protein VF796_00735 [Humisphaera sp.]
MSKRAVIRLQLDLQAKQKLDDLCEAKGMTQIAVLSRLVTWFGRQDEVIQASVLGLLSDEMLGGLTARLHGRLAAAAAAAGGGPGGSPASPITPSNAG